MAGQTRAVYANVKRQYVLDAFVPNDPYFHKNTPSGTWPGQWHLINEHVAGRDARGEAHRLGGPVRGTRVRRDEDERGLARARHAS